MIVVRPISITADMVMSSNIAEDDAPAWTSGTSYDLSDRALYAHRVYESLIDGNIGNQPDIGISADPPNWLDLGPANRYRMFDSSPSSTSQRAGHIEFVIAPGRAVNCVALINVSAVSVTVEQLSSAGSVIYSETRSLVDADPLGDGESDYLTDVAFLALQLASLSVRVLIDAAGGTAACGALIIGRQAVIGDTELGASLSITDYSRKDTDDFGDTTIVQRAFANTGDFVVKLDAARVGSVRRLLTSARATPTLYIGVSHRAETVLYGFYKSWTALIQTAVRATVNIEIETLTYEGSDSLFPDAVIDTPSITAPTAAAELPTNGTVTCSVFSTTPDDGDTHAASDWQIASDAAFADVIYALLDSADDLLSHTIPAGQLSTSTSYYVRVRHRGLALGASDWSSVVQFVTAPPQATIDTPVITTPAADGAVHVYTDALMSSAFSTTPASTETHVSTDWQIAADAAFADSIVSSNSNTDNLTSFVPPSMWPWIDGQDYYVRCRYRGADLGVSAWSAGRRWVAADPDITLTGMPSAVFFSGSGAASVTLTVRTDGTWTITRSGGSSYSGTWLTGSQSPGDCEVMFERLSQVTTGGSVSNGASSFIAVTSNRALTITCAYNASNGVGEYEATWRVTVRVIATPSISATADVEMVGAASG